MDRSISPYSLSRSRNKRNIQTVKTANRFRVGPKGPRLPHLGGSEHAPSKPHASSSHAKHDLGRSSSRCSASGSVLPRVVSICMHPPAKARTTKRKTPSVPGAHLRICGEMLRRARPRLTRRICTYGRYRTVFTSWRRGAASVRFVACCEALLFNRPPVTLRWP